MREDPLTDPEKICLPPLHIKLGLVKNFVKAFQKDGPAFAFLTTFFPKLSQAKIKEEVFVGPQIRKLMKNDADFIKTLNGAKDMGISKGCLRKLPRRFSCR